MFLVAWENPQHGVILTFFTIHIVLSTGTSGTEICFSFACISTTSKVLALISDSKPNYYTYIHFTTAQSYVTT